MKTIRAGQLDLRKILILNVFFILREKNCASLPLTEIVSFHSFLNVSWRDLSDNRSCCFLLSYRFLVSQVCKINSYMISVFSDENLFLSTKE
jgi:hypothetical protein